MRILHWNTNKSALNIRQILESNTDLDILAIQEPNAPGGRPPCPTSCHFNLIYGGGRAAIYINKKFPQHLWRAVVSHDFCGIIFDNNTAAVFLIYSPQRPNPPLPWTTPLLMSSFTENPPAEKIALLGDFNLHHPLWDREQRHSPGADILINQAEKWNLQLITLFGTPTRTFHGHRDSTIDLAWATAGTAIYEGEADFEGSDHRPQIIHFANIPSTRPEKRYCWKETDWEGVANAAKEIDIDYPHTPAEIDNAAANLQRQITRIANAFVPQKRPKFRPKTGRIQAFWTAPVVAAAKDTTAARRAWEGTRTEAAWRVFQERQKNHKRTRANARRAMWRDGIERAANKGGNLKEFWNLEKWARLRSHAPQDSQNIPALRPSENALPETDFDKKAAILSTRFFPDPIPEPEALNIDPPPSLDIDLTCDEEDIKFLLQHATPWKAPGLDKLPTGYLKALGKPFNIAMAKITDASFKIGHFPTIYKKAKIIVLPKPGKTRQQKELANAWRPISLLSCQGKIIEAFAAWKITKLAEKEGLLPEGQFGNRKGRSTETAIRFAIAAIRTAWK